MSMKYWEAGPTFFNTSRGIITWVPAGLGVVEQARLGQNSSLDSWEDAEGGVEVGVGVEAGVGVEGAADFSLLASFFRTASLVLWSAVDETVFLQWFLGSPGPLW